MRSRNPHARETGRNVLVRCGFPVTECNGWTGQSGKTVPQRNRSDQRAKHPKGQPCIAVTHPLTCINAAITECNYQSRNAILSLARGKSRDQRFYLTEHAS